jgi:hypothetical protein
MDMCGILGGKHQLLGLDIADNIAENVSTELKYKLFFKYMKC